MDILIFSILTNFIYFCSGSLFVSDKKYDFYLNRGRGIKSLKRVSLDDSEANKEINFDDYFQNNATFNTFDSLHPT